MFKNRFTYLFTAASVLIWGYLLLRAWFIPPVHDEAATFFHYINHGEFIPGHALWDANNHILNSFLSKYFIKVFGISAFSIRLANLCFFPIYAWFLYLFSKELKQEWSKYLLLITGLSIHGFIEYFAYSRGYGMSMAILTGALYYSYRFFSTKNIHSLLLAILLYLLATLSNLTLQNTALMFIGIAGLYILINNYILRDKIIGFVYLALAGVLLLPFVRLSLDMKRDGLLYYAADEDFWTAVIVSFTQQFFDSKLFALYIFWFVWTGIFAVITILFLGRLKNNWQLLKARLLFPLLFFGNLFSIFSMHYLLGVNYPSDRTGMHLVLYLFLGGIFLADSGFKFERWALVFPTSIFLIQFVAGANLSYSTYWKGEHLPERFWTRIYEEATGGKYISNPTVGGYKIRNLVWAWYNFKHGGVLQNMQYFDYYSGFEDYQLFSNPDYDSKLYDSLDIDPLSGVILARRKEFLKTELYLDSTGYSTPFDFDGEFYNLFESTETDSFINHSWLVEVDVKLFSLVTPPKINLVTTLGDKDGNVLDYDPSPLHWLKNEFRPEDKRITLKIWWHNVPSETKRIVVYLWNIDKDKYTLESASLRIYRVVK